MNDELVASFNYDQHGSSTIADVKELVRKISEKAGITFIED